MLRSIAMVDWTSRWFHLEKTNTRNNKSESSSIRRSIFGSVIFADWPQGFLNPSYPNKNKNTTQFYLSVFEYDVSLWLLRGKLPNKWTKKFEYATTNHCQSHNEKFKDVVETKLPKEQLSYVINDIRFEHARITTERETSISIWSWQDYTQGEHVFKFLSSH